MRPPPTVANGARSVEIVAGSLAFRPGALEVAAGENVAVTLRSTDVAHDLTIDDPGFHVHVDAGETEKVGLRIDTPGTYRAYCSVPGHRAAGMELVLTVTERTSP